MQNLLVLRFANKIFERMWGARNVDHVQITVAEAEGLGTRAMYYDRAGALRDMVQNHMLQTLALLTMEAPMSLDSEAIREAKLNVLRTLRPITPEDARANTVRARYGAGVDRRQAGRRLHGGTGDPDNSRTETFVALKAVHRQLAMVGGAVFHPHRQADEARGRAHIRPVQGRAANSVQSRVKIPANALTIRIQPDEGFSFEVMAKRPGLDLVLRPVRMNLQLRQRVRRGAVAGRIRTAAARRDERRSYAVCQRASSSRSRGSSCRESRIRGVTAHTCRWPSIQRGAGDPKRPTR